MRNNAGPRKEFSMLGGRAFSTRGLGDLFFLLPLAARFDIIKKCKNCGICGICIMFS